MDRRRWMPASNSRGNNPKFIEEGKKGRLLWLCRLNWSNKYRFMVQMMKKNTCCLFFVVVFFVVAARFNLFYYVHTLDSIAQKTRIFFPRFALLSIYKHFARPWGDHPKLFTSEHDFASSICSTVGTSNRETQVPETGENPIFPRLHRWSPKHRKNSAI